MNAQHTKQFTKHLGKMSDSHLEALVAKITQNGATPLPQPHSKGRMVKYILEHKDMLNVVIQESSGSAPDKQDIDDMKHHHIFTRVLMDIMISNSDKYTIGTLIGCIHHWFGIRKDASVILKPNFYENATEYLTYLSGLEQTDRLMKAQEIKKRTKDTFFEIISDETYGNVCRTLLLMGSSYADHEKRTPDILPQLQQKGIISTLMSAIRHIDISKIAASEYMPSPGMDLLESMPMISLATSGDEAPEPVPEAPAPVPEAPVPEAPAPVPEAPAPAPEGESPAPTIKIITDPTERAEFMKDTGGSLMFPTKYRQIRSADLTKSSWAKFRKAHNLTGRWGIFIETDPSNTKQNKNVKYSVGRFIDPHWEGAYEAEGQYYTDYPYGDIYIIPLNV
jgi:hypothetical protein